ncbi:hypothetical protein LPJ53_004095 [Coemansia erecta]|uniref:CS domain-containing protein n=1 Tax=Coemansia erecta TaxID=147472 RepID=A0A9W7XXW6_9FUNG|nr:hypothetical protein LPJ53_004095 [Coemansia erecta]
MAIGGGDSKVPSVDAASSFMLQYGQFEAAHRQQLESLGLPKPLWQVLFKKLSGDVFDIGSYAVFGTSDGSSSVSHNLTEHTLCLSQDKLDALSNVFLIDHAWTTTIDRAASELDSSPSLLERMETLTGIFEPHEKMPIMPNTESLDAANEINVPVVVSQTGVSEDRARELLNKNGGDIIEAILEASAKPDENTSKQQSIQDQIMKQLGGGDGDESSGVSASKPTEWRTRKYDCNQYALDSGSDKLDGIDVRIPVGYGVSTSDIKCDFSRRHIEVVVKDAVVLEGDLHADIAADEATWTLEDGTIVVSLVKKTAEYWPEALVGESHINQSVHNKHILRVLGDLWRYFQGYDYLAQNADESVVKRTNWYIQDEVGLSIGHSDDPNVICLPFLYLDPRGQMAPYSIMWPVKAIAKGDILMRDFCPLWLKDADQRKGYLQSIFPGPTQFALDAFEAMRDSWVQTAKNAVRANLTSLAVPKHQIQRVFLQGVSPDAAKAIRDAGLELADSSDAADVVFDDVPHDGDKQSNQHPLNSIFFSTENTVMAFQGVVGAQEWLRPGYHLKTQINEFIGAALMDGSSWWMLSNDQTIPNVHPQTIITSSWAAAVRHADVGYTSALKCVPSAFSPDKIHFAEKIVLLTPDNGLYVWNKDTWIYYYLIQQSDNKPDPYQILPDEHKVPESVFVELLAAHFGEGVFGSFCKDAESIILDVIRLMLGIDSSDGKNFGIFNFRFTFTKSDDDDIKPCLQQIRPVSVSERLAIDTELVPSIVAALAGNADDKLWKQLKNE